MRPSIRHEADAISRQTWTEEGLVARSPLCGQTAAAGIRQNLGPRPQAGGEQHEQAGGGGCGGLTSRCDSVNTANATADRRDSVNSVQSTAISCRFMRALLLDNQCSELVFSFQVGFLFSCLTARSTVIPAGQTCQPLIRNKLNSTNEYSQH